MMMQLKPSLTKAAFRISLFVVLLGTSLCALESVRAALVLLGVSAVLLGIWRVQQARQDAQLRAISDEIDRLLQGEESLSFSDSQEGAVGVLLSEIYKLTIVMREQNQLLRDSHAFMKESLEDISHQLRTPLTSMLLLVNMLSKPALTDVQRMGYVQELAQLNARMQWLIETLLKLSQMDAGVVQFRKENVDCAALIAAARAPLSISAELKPISICTEGELSGTFLGDFDRSVEALTNILKNCIEHTPAGGQITISTSETSLYTQILIRDTGAGIAKADLPHVFERFYRSSEFAKNGYGIGLAFAYQTMRTQNGSLTVENVSPHGVLFDLRVYHSTI